MIKRYLQFIKEDIQHLLDRGIDSNITHFIHDVETNNTYFFLYNLSGEFIGYQRYNPNYSKKNGNNYKNMYFTKVKKSLTGHNVMKLFGLEKYDISKSYLFVAEGIFDIIKIHNMGEPGVANLGCSVSSQDKNWYSTIPQIKIVIQDKDEAGSELGKIADYSYTVPEPYNDLGEMPQEEVNKFIENIKIELNIN